MGFCITKFFNTTLFMLEKIQYNEEFRIVVWSGSREGPILIGMINTQEKT